MAWTTPATWTTSQVVTAADLNAQLRDNLSFLYSLKGALVTNSATQSIATGAYAGLTFDTETFDTDGFHSTVTNTGRLTIPTGLDGYYLVLGQVEFATNATGNRGARIRLNGATQRAQTQFGPVAADQADVPVHAILSLVATDYVELLAYQSSGGALNVNAAIGNTWFGLYRIGG